MYKELQDKKEEKNKKEQKEVLIICRGGGDLATGIVQRLTRAGFGVLILETDKPAAIRRQVAFSEAVYDGKTTVEDITAVCLGKLSELQVEGQSGGTQTRGSDERTAVLRDKVNACFEQNRVPILVDPAGESISLLRPEVVVDAIIAKRNLGTERTMAELVIGVGPGFTAGADVDFVVETMRGHNLGRIIAEGSALPNTGTPGNIGGYTRERVIHAACAGTVENIARIGDVVRQGQEIARIHSASGGNKGFVSVEATISGVLRGLIRSDFAVTEGFKIADIDPRIEELKNCFTISDKSRSIGGSVLELVAGYANGSLKIIQKK